MQQRSSDNKISAHQWIWRCTKGKHIWVLLLIVVRVASSLCSVFEALALKDLINSATGRNSGSFVTYCIVFAGLILAQICMWALARYLDERVKATIENQLKARLFNTLLKKDFSAVAARHSGDWMMRLTSDTVLVASNVAEIIPNLSGMVAKFVGAVALIIALMDKIALVIIPCALLSMAITLVLRKRLKKLHKRIQESDGRLRSFLTERLSNLMIVKSFGMEDQTLEQASEKMGDHYEKRMQRIRFLNFCNICFNLIVHGIYVAAVIYCGRGILIGSMDFGIFAAITKLVGEIKSPIANVSSYIPRWYAMLASAERLMEAEEYRDDIEGAKKTDEEIAEFYKNSFKGIAVKDACFSYSRTGQDDLKNAEQDRSARDSGAACDPSHEAQQLHQAVMHDIELSIRKQEIAAVTGHSGCGKSTLLKLLMCLYPLDSGHRMIESESGEFPLDATWRGLFAYVPQGNQLMSGTIKDVLTFSDPSVEPQKIYMALEIACAREFVDELPSGLETPLGERGTGLSEGQMQRLAIARAILSGHPVLLLDEATSSLDEDTEARLLVNLKQLTDRTVIIVTHRLRVLSICSSEIHMDETGTHVTYFHNNDIS